MTFKASGLFAFCFVMGCSFWLVLYSHVCPGKLLLMLQILAQALFPL